ncbi:MAG: DUF2336 domain-containing protein [Xanthobacteraceae bacterium]|nr:DUF2336 domain-containing protein [Xanthobacteraceae bacterium]PWB64907.1 MAG: hypothetical protein C3F17_05760 [Bradyrhizobiaceae bacterium]
MAALASLIPELEDLLQGASSAKRAETLRRITELFLAGAERYSSEHVALFDDVLSELVIEIEMRALAELSGRVAAVENGPPKLLRRLAENDDISVAGPVLTHARRLADADLVAIAKSKSQDHLRAISGRRGVSEAVTDVIVQRGDARTVRKVADNRDARFSHAGLAALVRRATRDGDLAEKVARRTDVPPHMFRQLLMQATDIVQKRLLASAKPETRFEIRQILARVSGEISELAAPERDFSAAQRTVLSLHRDGKLSETDLVNFAGAGQYEHTVAALAALCGISLDIIDRLLSGERPDPALILCKAAGFGWPTARAIITASPGGRRLAPRTLDTAKTNFERLSYSTAQRVLRFWQARQGETEDEG